MSGRWRGHQIHAGQRDDDDRTREGGRGAHGGRRQPRDNPSSRKPIIKVYQSDFAQFHALVKAARYKVHKPICSCKKMVDIRHRPWRFVNQPSDPESVGDGRSADDEDARRKQKMHDVAVEEEPLNGLIVLPQTKAPNMIYFSAQTSLDAYLANPLGTELKLRDEIFGPERGTAIEATEEISGEDNPKQRIVTPTPFKLSCAACLLEDEPNGFACLSFTDVDRLMAARDQARDSASHLRDDKAIVLHADHAHHVAIIPRSVLEAVDQSRTRSETRRAEDALFEYLANQNVPVRDQAEHRAAGIVLGHHLTSALNLTRKVETAQDMHWFVMIYNDTQPTARNHHDNDNSNNKSTSKAPCWTLDLPGGKRYLGETSVQSAIRETMEESSLAWDASWIREERQSLHPHEQSDRFFFLTPPSLVVE